MLEVWCRTLRIKPGRWLTALGSLSALAMIIFMTAPRSIGQLVVTGITGTIFAAIVASRRTQNDTNLKIDPKQIEDAWSSGTMLVLHLKSGAVVEAEPAKRTPDDILAELGLTLDQRALTAPLRGVLGSFTRGLLAFLFAWIAATSLTLPLRPLVMVVSSLVVAIATSWLVVRTLRPRVTVGLDGLRVTGVLRPKFVSYAHVRAVRMADYVEAAQPRSVGRMLVIETDAEPLELPLVGQSNEQMEALVRRIARGRERYAAEAARTLDVLARAGRPMREWLESLRKLPGGFRAAALDPIDLEQVVADPKAPLERRLGAALALRDDPEARKRVRVAAEQSAEPRVRVALEAAAAEEIDESEIERALKE